CMLCLALDRPVALHTHDAVDDGELRYRDGALDVDDALVESRPVKHVLRPSVHRAGNHAEQILEGEGHAGPVVRLQLRHGDQQIGPEYRLRERELPELRESASGADGLGVVEVEIEILDVPLPEDVPETGRGEQIFVITP